MVDLTGEVPLDDGTTLVVAHDGLQTIPSSHTYQAVTEVATSRVALA